MVANVADPTEGGWIETFADVVWDCAGVETDPYRTQSQEPGGGAASNPPRRRLCASVLPRGSALNDPRSSIGE